MRRLRQHRMMASLVHGDPAVEDDTGPAAEIFESTMGGSALEA
jgi:hypothetical protein